MPMPMPLRPSPPLRNQSLFSDDTGSLSGSDHDHFNDHPTIEVEIEPWLTSILDNAAEYEVFLSSSPADASPPPSTSALPLPQINEENTRLSLSAPKRGRSLTNASVTDLVGRDLATLGDAVRAGSSRIQHLTAVDWTNEGTTTTSSPSSSPTPLLDTSSSPDSSPSHSRRPSTDHEFTSSLASTNVTTPVSSPSAADLKLSLSLDTRDLPAEPSNEEKVRIFEEEFGVLRREGGEEERILYQFDGGFWQEVAIIGVVHLTTHRLAFHASLLSARPDLLPDQQILRSGAATIHRPNPYRKRKVWLELAHDMISTFRSSNDVDRVRPQRTVLLSDIDAILPPTIADPLTLTLQIRNSPFRVNPRLTFDTTETTHEWLRDIQAALYLYRRRRHDIFSNSDPEEVEEANGVRISIPLERIEKTELERMFPVTIPVSAKSTQQHVNLYKWRFYLSGEEVDRNISFAIHEGKKEEVLRLLYTYREMRLEDASKSLPPGLQLLPSLSLGGEEELELAPVIVDFGSLTFMDEGSIRSPVEVDGISRESKVVKRTFGIPSVEDIWLSRAHLHKGICSIGFFALSSRFMIFWAKSHGFGDVKYRMLLSRIKSANAHKTIHLGYGMKVDIEGHKSMLFSFRTTALRDEAVRRLNESGAGAAANGNANGVIASPPLMSSPKPMSTPASSSNGSFPFHPSSSSSSVVRSDTLATSASASSVSTQVLSPLSRTISLAYSKQFSPAVIPLLPKVINLPAGLTPHISPRHFVCLTIGSRGDVQPYIALGKGLMAEGHRVTIVTHEEYKAWVESFGIGHRTAGGDPGALMALSVEHTMFSPSFFKESLTRFRSWLDDLLRDAWEQCFDADILIESPSAMAGVHIAEALDIPYFRAFTMPWSKTSEYPHAFISPPVEAPSFNSGTYILFDNVLWVATSGQINRWRREVLQLPNTDMSHMAQNKIPFLYNFSPAVVPKPLDWRDDITICGYWFLDNPDLKWKPSEELLAFMQRARDDGKPLVYIGFGSITVPRPAQMTRAIIKAVNKSGVRAIISKGWSARMVKEDEPEIVYPADCFLIDSIPHDWLFPKVDAALHHGGAGTTGASLRAGIPTLIKPWFGDQFFWASRVQKLGAGLRVPSLRSSALAEALKEATTDRIMKEKAAEVGVRIRSEDGVKNAIHAIYTFLPRASRPRVEPRAHTVC